MGSPWPQCGLSPIRHGHRGKKLRDAARLIAVGVTAADPATGAEIAKLREDLEFFGATPEQVSRALAKVGPATAADTFEVVSSNVTAVRLFQGMATQWNTLAIATLDRAELRRVGLRYEVIDRVARGLAIEERPGDFARLQLMEAEALVAWSEARH